MSSSSARDAQLATLACRIRAFELQLLEAFRRDLVSGTIHSCVGQEFCAAALHAHLDPERDAFFGSHRSHGHYLAFGGPPDGLMAELLGREGALCLGRGGSQHLHWRSFYSNGIQGGMAAAAVGYAWAYRRRGTGGIVVAQIGDGTFGEGALHEAFTFAALLQVPVLFYVEYNGIAQSTDVSTTTPGDLLVRLQGFGLPADRRSDADPDGLCLHLGQVVARMREQATPFVQIVDTRRLLAHSKGDDTRPAELVAELERTDPLNRLLGAEQSVRAARHAADEEMAQLLGQLLGRPLEQSGPGEALPDGPERSSVRYHAELSSAPPRRVVEELNEALHGLLASGADVLLIGEDLLDPYGGAFKVARGLSSRFPGQLFSTPIAEAAILGLANGLALAGCRPVAEMMFGDFTTLAVDQLVNHAAKFYAMYGGRQRCPLTVRLVSGGGRGYGPTHSQSLEGLLCGVPGLRVVALSARHRPAQLLCDVVLTDDAPTVFVENKLLYAQRPATGPPLDLCLRPVVHGHGHFPPLCYVPERDGRADLTLVTYGGMTSTAEQAMRQLILEDELRFEYIVLSQLWPLLPKEIVDSVQRTAALVVVEEGTACYGVGAAVIAACAEQLSGRFACRAVGARPLPIPCARHLEARVLPQVADVVTAVRACLGIADPGPQGRSLQEVLPR